jgi:anaerobic magnesium-protoporphyrin IX monomethyl ester cyclase
MRVVLADLDGGEGLVEKDSVAGGYGSRLRPFSRVTRLYAFFKRREVTLPSIQLGYLAAIFARMGHRVVYTRGPIPEGDLAIVLSSLVDYRRETAWAREARRRGLRTGFIGLACSTLPELFREHADFLILGEPERAAQRLAVGEAAAGALLSEPVADLNSLPFPRWDLLERPGRGPRVRRRFPVLASRGCPEHCTYCPHRVLAHYRARSPGNVAEELGQLADRYPRPHIVFRDPLFTQDRERCLELCEQICARGLRLTFDCETRLDALDEPLLRALSRAGLRAVSFGVETAAAETLKRVARRPVPEPRQRAVVETCRRLGIMTVAYYVLGFPQDDWKSIAATIDYAISLGTTFAQFKLLTPYPATPLWRQLAAAISEPDWQKFDGYTPTFRHPHLSAEDLRFLLGAAYARFYARPGWLLNYWNALELFPARLVESIDRKALAWHAEKEISLASRAAEC